MEKTITNDPVNHPSHYCTGNIEVIDFIEDQKFPYHLGNAVKYICRAGKKNPDKIIEDLQKAMWYINRYISVLRKKEADERGEADKAAAAAGGSDSTEKGADS